MTKLFVSAFGLATAYGTGLGPISLARDDNKLPFARCGDIIGNDYQPQLCAFASELSLDNFEQRVKMLVARALNDLSDMVTTRGLSWQPVQLVLLTPNAEDGLDSVVADHVSKSLIQNYRM